MGSSNSQVMIFHKAGPHPKGVELEFQLRPTLNSPDGCQISGSPLEEKISPDEGDEGKRQVEASEELELCKSAVEVTTGGEHHDKEKAKEEEVEGGEENDGFRTPTSSEHKIPVITECPPAPRKPSRSEPLKRKACPNCCRVRVDLTDDLESLFRPVLADTSLMIKKARKKY